MKSFIKTFCSFTLILLSLVSFSQSSHTVAPLVTYTYESVADDPMQTRIYTLKNGLKVYLSINRNSPRIYTNIAVRAGSKNDPAHATGLAHYLEHMVFKGTDKIGTKNWTLESKELEKIEQLYEDYKSTTDDVNRKKIYHRIDSISGKAAEYAIANEYDKMISSIGGLASNAYTSFDQTVYVCDIPSNQISNWLKIESERFRKLVLRLFHTELEAVYEEKNISLDNDDDKLNDAIMSGLFKNHTYGTQTTIGTIAHLKNPSMKEIHAFFKSYYVPNNMAVIMSGDLDPDKTIVEIDKYFGKLQASSLVPTYSFAPEQNITERIKTTVIGPEKEKLAMAWRTAGAGSKDEDLLNLLNQVLYNNVAGIFDTELIQAQKLRSVFSYFWSMKDYGLFMFQAEPKESQTLEELEQLISARLASIHKGEIPEWLIEAAKKNLNRIEQKAMESNEYRVQYMCNAFVSGIRWEQQVNQNRRIEKINKMDLVDFVKEKIPFDKYLVVYKTTGVSPYELKVVKPDITPVNVDQVSKSIFANTIYNSKPKSIEPVFLDYSKELVNKKLGSGTALLYKQNTENGLYELEFRIDHGTQNDPLLQLAVNCFTLLGTEGKSASDIRKELFRNGSDAYVQTDQQGTYFTLTGIQGGFNTSLNLFLELLTKPVLSKDALSNAVADHISFRKSLKKEKRVILSEAMLQYALHGERNPFNSILDDQELKDLTPENIINKLKELFTYNRHTLYYGPLAVDSITTKIRVFDELQKTDPSKADKPLEYRNSGGKVFVYDFDMKQAEIMFVSKGGPYSKTQLPEILLYNNYFGGGLNSVVFQQLRESKALAYGVSSNYVIPKFSYNPFLNISYIGTQSDKLPEAMHGMISLLKNMPNAPVQFKSAKDGLLQDISTKRFQKMEVLQHYMDQKALGLTETDRKQNFERIKTFTFENIRKFQETSIKNQPINTLLIGKRSELDLKTLQKYGEVIFLTDKQLFGF